MKIAIIGGGITGLTAAHELAKAGHEVTVFEKEKEVGGLAGGFREKGWDWYLEKSYHHLFTNDHVILSLLDELGLHDKLIIKRPITATFISQKSLALNSKLSFDHGETGNIFQLDSPMNLLTFPYLSPVAKVRTAVLLAFLKLNPFWQPLEAVTAEHFFKTIGGDESWHVLWEPLMQGKFGDFSHGIAASWLWARIKKRTPRLCYIDGGFKIFIDALTRAITNNGGKIYTNTAVAKITRLDNSQFLILHSPFDTVLLTVPTPIAARLIKFPTSYIQPLMEIPHLHAQTLIVETKKPILKDVYWLNISDRSFPFLAAVAHTNYMDPKHYAGHHLTYFGNYLPAGHPYLSMTKQQLLELFLPHIKHLTHNSSFIIHNSFLFNAPFAQPVHMLHYSKIAPTIHTPIPNVFYANLDSIYPWDRGTNYSVELGQKAAETIVLEIHDKER